MPPLITAICASYNRPRLLGQAIAQFLAQDYPHKRLLILEDSGIFEGHLSGPGWDLLCSRSRRDVGEKRNWLVEHADSDLIAVWDDDDGYLPWHLSACAEALQRAPWCQPRQALEWRTRLQLERCWVFGEPVRSRMTAGETPQTAGDAADCCYGAQWSFCRAEFRKIGGYPVGFGSGEDTQWGRTMFQTFGPSADIDRQRFDPSYIYSRAQSQSWHGSEMGPGMAYFAKVAKMPRAHAKDFKIVLPDWYGLATKQIPADTRPRRW